MDVENDDPILANESPTEEADVEEVDDGEQDEDSVEAEIENDDNEDDDEDNDDEEDDDDEEDGDEDDDDDDDDDEEEYEEEGDEVDGEEEVDDDEEEVDGEEEDDDDNAEEESAADEEEDEEDAEPMEEDGDEDDDGEKMEEVAVEEQEEAREPTEEELKVAAKAEAERKRIAALPDTTKFTFDAKVQKKLRDSVRVFRKQQQTKIEQLKEATLNVEEDDAGARLKIRLVFLARQSHVFMTQGDASKAKGKDKKKSAAKGRRGRMSEAAGDAESMRQQQNDVHLCRMSTQPSIISKRKGTMRDYQIEGLNWIVNLYIQGINGILADEMGLGKTLQTISVLAYLREFMGINGPHLVVVPKSTLGNWMKEFNVWCPSFKCLRFHGNKAERKLMCKSVLASEYDVVVTTYEVVNSEKGTLQRVKWCYMVIDEAHRIKNENATLSQTVRTFDVEARLLLTGTPLQNNLHELWALLNFLMPDIFESSDDFDQWFQDDGLNQADTVKRLHTILRPFLLRRLKSDVEHSLKPKIETKLYIGMSEMQKYWYKKILTKDAVALNQLGGAGKVRLLNILMQLRKCCNHPYLFEGAEPGPPYEEGPHLWEEAGKMVLLDKLLGKLKTQGSRVLIFTQMTRQLDILEDYMRYKQYGYCRIDGSTSGELRESQMDAFNAPGSELFVFMLSTRAGGLGINLQTADIVILYDSDWNPQADLQAQDRAHRIGQKKQVRVFRFVTENTVEEKIIERAERKLYLDAVVIQQGRLLQQNRKLSKGELESMVKFGAETIFKSNKSTITDEDIDAILAAGSARTTSLNDKIKTDMQHSLQNFTLGGEQSLYDYADKDFVELTAREGNWNPLSNMISLGARKKRRNYDVNEYFREAMNTHNNTTGGRQKVAKPKSIPMHDFQFFQQARIKELFQKEFELSVQKREQVQTIKVIRGKETRERRKAMKQEPDLAAETILTANELKTQAEELESALHKYDLTEEESKEKETLISEGMGKWIKSDFRKFLSACERHGRKAQAAICTDVALATGKTEQEVREYFDVFWRRYKELGDWKKIIDKIERGERKIQRRHEIEEAIKSKVSRHKDPYNTLSIEYGSNKGKAFTEEEDRFLLCKMSEIGYGQWHLMQLEIRKAWQFRFDWFLKSRTAAELQRRSDSIIRLVEKENKAKLTKRKRPNKSGSNKKKKYKRTKK